MTANKNTNLDKGSRGVVMRVDAHGSNAYMKEEKEELSKVNTKLVGVDCVSEDEIISGAKDADVILTGEALMTRRVMEGLPKCKAIIRYGIGYDLIDVPAATDNNIMVVNVPDFCFEEVANHGLALLLVCAKKIVLLNNMVKQGRWVEAKQAQIPMGSIRGETLGIIGCGNIGRTFARKAQCLELRVLGYDPYVDKTLASEAGITLVSLHELLKEADYISLNPIMNKETWHMISDKEFKQMKPSAYLINIARGPVVDEVALIKALQEKRIAGAGLDVFEKEPVDPQNPLLQMDNVVVLPHSASYSDAAFIRLRTTVGQEAARVVCGHLPKNIVNKTVKPKVKLTKEG
jgi:D-3-phosphoglycerate dehydrogenase